MDALALTLGHNSSAVLIRNGEIVAGYEEERFTQRKSDSVFPANSISKLDKRYKIQSNVNVCVSHWFPDGKLGDESKYWSLSYLESMFPKCNVVSLQLPEFTHHDAHAQSALLFAGKEFPKSYGLFVIDGFGTLSEHISVYEYSDKYLLLKKRLYGFKHSVGLFYQYATAFCGMRMHQDEYKMLAYETHVFEHFDTYEIERINSYVDNYSYNAFDLCLKGNKKRDLSSLVTVKSKIDKELLKFLEEFAHNDDPNVHRILISYFAQRHLENMIKKLYLMFLFKNLIVVGGVFYNVKINSMLCDMVPGKFCAMPLAGDQGAGLGVYQRYFGDLKWPNHLFWGHRTIDPIRLEDEVGLEFVRRKDMKDVILEKLGVFGMVNVVRGPMEFGPRALCNTSTLAYPDKRLAKQINEMNSRTNEMPFGLVVTQDQAKELFCDIEKVHKSLEYMIITRQFKGDSYEDVIGGAHYYPITGTYTCRPQVTKDPMMVELLKSTGPLINTSWNYHGTPIVRSTDEILYTHKHERYLASDFVITLIEEELKR